VTSVSEIVCPACRFATIFSADSDAIIAWRHPFRSPARVLINGCSIILSEKRRSSLPPMDASMLDDLSLTLGKPRDLSPVAPGGATIIPFPVRFVRAPSNAAVPLLDAVTEGLEPKSRQHAPTMLAACGALAGFATQQALLLEGGSAWTQPVRAERLDTLLLSEASGDASLWWSLTMAAHTIGAQHLPDPRKLLASTLKCVGTSQFGQITLPLEYRLQEQPQTALVRLWARVRTVLDKGQVSPAMWARLMSAMCAERVVASKREVPPHVALRILMQAALAMALVEPRVVPGAALKAENDGAK
jgi:hypothetical protein